MGSGAIRLWVSSPAAEALGTDLGSRPGWEEARVPSVSFDEADLVSEDFNSPGWLGVSPEAFSGTEEVGVSVFRLVLASVPPLCAAPPASLATRE